MKNRVLVLVLCSFLFAGATYFTASGLEESAITSCFIFGDASGGY